MARFRSLVVAIAVIAIVSSCGSSAPTTESAVPESAADTLPAAPPAVEQPAATAAPAQVAEPTASPLPSQAVELDQPAIWPASDVVFDTPEQAAASFVSDVLGVEPVLGDFMAGDSRSGEIQVFSPGEGASPTRIRTRAARPPHDRPERRMVRHRGQQRRSDDRLSADARSCRGGSARRVGTGRGFESTLVVTAFAAGDATAVLDQVISSGGAFESLEPFSATLDLSGAAQGDVVALLVRGDVGLEDDPGEFASLPVVIGDPLPETR